ncbi:hypothetical protein GCM10023190_06620 [Enteractinococcus fodinae]|uniref:Uncharacterized protein n=1 Tax=Enteractinococcus fodinae TaxID=684663 RepID=A0ABU2B0Q6_9MICC|nr:hypothetical protein [Enteractinococcus fodinae]MDR7346861.1 hypothetical protein [Enteractinococcus fodinae]
MSPSSGHHAPPPPEQNYGYPYTPQETSTKKSSRSVPILVSGLVGLVLGVGGTLGVLALTTDVGGGENVADSNDTETPPAEPDTAGPSIEEEASDEPSLPSPPSPELSVDDFEIETSVKEQRCFGSAGCNLTIRTEPFFTGSSVPVGLWEVTYEITGIEDQPMIRTFEVSDDEISFDSEARVSVESEDFDIQTEITDVREGFERG